MRNSSLVIWIALISVLSATSADSLIAYYPFNGNANDESGNEYNGTELGGITYVTNRFNNANSAISFNSDFDLIELPYQVLNARDEFSISLWLKTTGYAGTFISAANSSDDNEFLIQVRPDTNSIAVVMKQAGVDGDVGLADDRWHHFVLNRNNTGVIQTWVDGSIDINYMGNSGVLDVSDGGLWLGNDQDNIGGGWSSIDQFIGLIDEIRIYNRELSISEIDSLYYLNGWPAPETPTNVYASPGNQQIALRWNANSESDLAKYRVYRDTSSPASTLIDSVAGAPLDTVYTDTGLINGQTYYYRITAVDDSGNESNYSDEVSGIPQIPAQLLSVSPTINDIGVEIGTIIEVLFSTSIIPSTINDTSSFLVYGNVSGRHRGTFSITNDNKTISFNPSTAFFYGEDISVRLTNRIKSENGSSIIPFVWEFSCNVIPSSGTLSENEYFIPGNQLAFYDLNDDNFVDLVSNSVSDHVSVYLNDGNGVFPNKSDYPLSNSISKIAIGDIDLDGDGDILYLDWSNPSLYTLFNNGDGTFDSELNNEYTGNNPHDFCLYDFDNDGDDDVFIANQYSNWINVLINNGDGQFTTQYQLVTGTNVNNYSIDVRDIDGDGFGDIVVGVNDIGNPERIAVFRNDKNGGFLTRYDHIITGAISTTLADINNDNNIDIISALSYLINNGDGSYSGLTSFGATNPVYSSLVVDIDGDVDNDILSINANLNTCSVFSNNGNGVFTNIGDFNTEEEPWNLFLADIDSDGDVDVFTSNNINSTISLSKNITNEVVLNSIYPTNEVCVTISTIPISVNLKNLSLEPKNIPVICEIDTIGGDYSVPLYSQSALISDVMPNEVRDEVIGSWTADLNGKYKIRVFSELSDDENHGNDTINVNFNVIVATQPIIVVYESEVDAEEVIDALINSDYPYNKIQKSDVISFSLSKWQYVIWVSEQDSGINEVDADSILSFLNIGRGLLLIGNQLAYSQSTYPSSSPSSVLIRDKLGINWQSNFTSATDIFGNANDPISNNVDFTLFLGSGIKEKTTRSNSIISGITDSIMTYSIGGNASWKHFNNNHKIIYLGFPINNVFPDSMRNKFIDQAMCWLQLLMPPQNLTAYSGNGNVTLIWRSNNELELSKYWIYRDTTSPAITLVDSIIGTPPDTLYFNTGLTNGQTYFFRITAADTAGKESNFSNEVSATPRCQLYTVKTDETGDYTIIQTAIDATTDGDTVLVHPGTYVENINYNGKNIVVGSLFLTTQDTSYISSTIIDGNQSGRVVEFQDGETNDAQLVGLTIQNGFSTDVGGGIVSSSSPTLKFLIIKNNTARYGGGLSVLGEPVIENIRFYNNNASDWGGAIVFNSAGIVNVSNCIFIANQVTEDHYRGGGAICSASKDVNITNSTFSGNESAGLGSAISTWDNSTISLKNCIVYNNEDNVNTNQLGTGTFGGSYDVSYSLIGGGWSGTGNINSNPLFVDAANRDYYLTNYSPAIGAGLDSSIVPTTDLNGNQRPNPPGSNPDIGAYENPLALPLAPPSPTSLTATSGNGIVNLSWTGNEYSSSYSVYRSTTSGSNYTLVDNIGDTTAFTDTGLTNDTTYYYVVTATGAGGESDYSTEVAVTPKRQLYTVKKDGTGDYTVIQTAIDVTSDGDTVLVYPGTYVENINFNGKNIVVGSLFLTTQDTSYISSTIIDGNQNGSVVTFESGEDTNSILYGLTIKNGIASMGGGIYCNNSSPNLKSLIIRNNSAYNYGGGIYCQLSSPQIINSIIKENNADSWGGGIDCHNSSTPQLLNSIISKNSAGGGSGLSCYNQSNPVLINTSIINNNQNNSILTYELSNPILINTILWNSTPNEIYELTGGTVTARYSNIRGGWVGIGNTESTPLFVDIVNDDFWLSDYSPCIGTGTDSVQIDDTWYYAPTTDIDGDPRPNPAGSNPDMGAYENPLAEPLHNNFIHVTITGNDTGSVGLESAPFKHIQSAIDYSQNADTVLVHPGTYVENINFNGKNIVVGSLFLTTQDTTYISSTIIDGNQSGSVVTFESGEDTNTVLIGFTITNGYANGEYPSNNGGGIYCEASPSLSNLIIQANSATNVGGGLLCIGSPILENLLIIDNSAYSGGGIFFSSYSNKTIKNLTISGNTAGYGGAISSQWSDLVFINSIIWGNSAAKIEIQQSSFTSYYSDIQGGQSGFNTDDSGVLNWLEGNIDSDPMFVNSNNGDYRLSDYSPCIGAGIDSIQIDGTWYYAPLTDIEGNPRPDPAGSNTDMGAYENPLAEPLHNTLIYVATTGNDTGSVGLESSPFKHIQSAIDYSQNADTVLVHPGTYVENINFNGKNIVVGSLFLTTGDTSYISSTIIDGNQAGRVVTIASGEDSTSMLSGFTLQNGKNTHGGGIYIINTSSPQLNNLVIRNNVSTGDGGGLFIYYDSNCNIKNLKVINNSSVGSGGGICSRENHTCFENVLIVKNTASTDGGGASFYGDVPHLVNVTISDNVAGERGGGIFCNDFASIELVNTILWNNSPQEIFILSGNVISSYSCIEGGYTGTEIISSDPLFVDASADDYHLTDSSPCIGAGTTDNAPSVDLAGNTRPNPEGSNPDIGVYEHELSQPQRLPYVHVYPTGNDTTGDGSLNNPYRTLNKALTITSTSDTIKVHAGMYADSWEIAVGQNVMLLPGVEYSTGSHHNRGFLEICGTQDSLVKIFDGQLQYMGSSSGNIKYLEYANSTENLWIDSDIEIDNSIFHDITCNNWLDGGAIAIVGERVTIKRCVFYNNIGSNGSCISAEVPDSVYIANCTFVSNNSTGSNQCAIYAWGSGHILVKNSIFWNNDGSQWYAVDSIVDTAYNLSDTIDPLFVDEDSYNYHLQYASPAIDAGDPDNDGDGTTWESDPDDQDPDGSRLDIGAYYITRVPYNGPMWYVSKDGKNSYNGSEQLPFSSIQTAIDYSVEGDTVLVYPGTYIENINFIGKNIVVGSLYLTTQDTSYISSTIIDGNQAGSVVTFHNSADSNAVLAGITLRNGRSEFGGGIYIGGASPLIKYCHVKNNTATSTGGGIRCYTGSHPIIENTIVSTNSAAWNGGGIYTYEGDLTIKHCLISSNSAANMGGGIYVEQSITDIYNTIIAENSGAGGISINGAGTSVNFGFCTIINNEQQGILANNDSRQWLKNSVVYNNNLPIQLNSYDTLYVSYSLVEGGIDAIIDEQTAHIYWNTGNIDADPLFVDVIVGDYRLSDYSPCIGIGVDSVQIDGTWYYAPTTDLDGNPRPNPANSNPDIGAYENPLAQPNAPPVPTNLAATAGNSIVNLTWTGNQYSTSYSVYRSTTSGSGYALVSNVGDTTAYSNTGLTNDTTYYFVVTATGAGGESGYSEEVSATTRCQLFTVKTDGTGNYTVIQTAIDATADGDTVLVHPGTYFENINFNGKNIVVGSLFLTTQDTSYISSTIIDGNQAGSVVTFNAGETRSTILDGLSIIHGKSEIGGGIFCSSSNPTLRNLIVKDNISDGGWDQGGGGIGLMSLSSPLIQNVEISNNVANENGGGIYSWANGDIILVNVTIVNNSSSVFGGGIFVTEGSYFIVNSIITENYPNEIESQWNSPLLIHFDVDYSFIKNGTDGIILNTTGSLSWGGNNTTLNPIFVDTSNGDYHLSNYSPGIGAGVDSTQIDGNWYNAPTTDLDGAPRPNPAGSNPDIGAYENPLPSQRPQANGIADGLADDIDWISSLTTLSANWESFTDDSTVNYEYAIGTSTTDLSDILNWTANGTDTSVTSTGLTLYEGATYYLSVRGTDIHSQVSDTATTDGVTVDVTSPSVIAVSEGNGPTTVTDIDGNVYQTVTIGDQVWVRDNLKVTHYRNGDAIPNVTGNSEWSGLSSGAWCSYNNDDGNVATYGRLYTWYAVNDSRNIAPEGWHVPTDEDWKELEMYLGMSRSEADEEGWRGTDEGGKLKEAGTAHWSSPNSGATNESGFTALPGGYRNNGGDYVYMGYYGAFWSSTEFNSYGARYRILDSNHSDVRRNDDNKHSGYSVRCLRDLTIGQFAYFDADYQNSTATLIVSWSGSDDASGIMGYEYALGTTSGGTETLGWTVCGLATADTLTSLSLDEGTVYYLSVRVTDVAGNLSTVVTGDGIQLDVTAPVAGAVNDGTESDIAFTGSGTELSANWSGFSDNASGIEYYEYAIGTTSGGTDVVAWTNVGTSTGMDTSGLSLSNGQSYYVSVRATDYAANVSLTVTSDGVVADLAGPVAGTVIDGVVADLDWTNSTTELSGKWSGFSDELSGIDYYEYALGTTSGGIDVITWTGNDTARSVSLSSLDLSEGVSYYLSARAVDNVGNTGNAITTDGITVDLTLPQIAAVYEGHLTIDRNYQNQIDSLVIGWSGSDDASGIMGYEYALGTTSGGTETLGWTVCGLATADTLTSLSLDEGTVYYLSVRVTDVAGNLSTVVTGDGIQLDVTAPVAGTVNDGTESDLAFTGSDSTLIFSWSGFNDNISGIEIYQYCVGTVSGNDDILDWTDIISSEIQTVIIPTNDNPFQEINLADQALDLPSTRSLDIVQSNPKMSVDTQNSESTYVIENLELENGSTYYISLRAVDKASNLSDQITTNGITVDTAPPNAGIVIDGIIEDIDWTNITTRYHASWQNFEDEISGLDFYEYSIGSEPGFADVYSWYNSATVDTVHLSGLSLSDGGSYYFNVKATDIVGNISEIASSNGLTVDLVKPVVSYLYEGAVDHDIDFQAQSDSLLLYWDATDNSSGLHSFEYALGSQAGDSSIVDWVEIDNSTTTKIYLNEWPEGDKYYSAIRARDTAGNLSEIYIGNGITPDLSGPEGSLVIDGLDTDLDFTDATNSLVVSWNTFTDELSGVKYYETQLGTTPGGFELTNWVSTGLDTFTTISGLSLIDAQTYYHSVRAVDNVDNVSQSYTSDGISVDYSAPITGTVNDGLSGDKTWSNSDSTLALSWTGFIDVTSGIKYYEYAFGYNVGQANFIAWTPYTIDTFIVVEDLNLTNGSTFYGSVRAVDSLDHVSTIASSNGVTIDIFVPTVGVPTDGGSSDIDYQSDSTQLIIAWTGSDTREIDYFMYSIGTTPGGFDVVNWTNIGAQTTVTVNGLDLNHHAVYYANVLAYDEAGNISQVASSDGVQIDLSAPTVGYVYDGLTEDHEFTASQTSLSVSWSDFADTTSGIQYYEYAIGTTPGLEDVKGWTNVGLATSETINQLILSHATKYYTSIRATDNVQNLSNWIASDGISADLFGPVGQWVIDGDSIDIDYANVNTEYHAYWSTFIDTVSGFDHYQVALYDKYNDLYEISWQTDIQDTVIILSNLTLEEGHTYSLQVIGVDLVGNNGSMVESDGVYIDLSAPETPQAFTGQFSSNRILLDWLPNTESDLNSYLIYGGLNPDPDSLIITTDVDTAEAFLPEYQDGNRYYFRIAAIDVTGNISNESSDVSGIPQIPTVTYLDPVETNILHPDQKVLNIHYSQQINDIGDITLSSVTGETVAFNSVYLEVDTSITITITDQYYSCDTLDLELKGVLDWAGNSAENLLLEYMTYTLADYNDDGLVEFSDLTDFISAWESEDFSYELGPVIGDVPHLVASPNSVYDLDDIMTFTRMWNWSHQHYPTMMLAVSDYGDGITIVQQGNQLLINLPEKAMVGQFVIQYPQLSSEVGFSSDDISSNKILLKKETPEIGQLLFEYAYIKPSSNKSFVIDAKAKYDANTDIIISYQLFDLNKQLVASGNVNFEVIAIPEKFALHQNYPNPFNPVTTINYDLPEDVRVKLTIHDIMGRQVAQLVNEEQQAGYKSAQWNGKNSSGQLVSAGMYFYTIEAGDYSAVRKMILLK